MTRESDLAVLREGLLPDEKAPRASLDDNDSSESDLETNELEELNANPSSPRIRGGWSPIKRKKKGNKNPDQISKRKGGWLRNKTCLYISVILVGALIALLAGIYGRVFKGKGLRPQDGVSAAVGLHEQSLMSLHLAIAAMVHITQGWHRYIVGR